MVLCAVLAGGLGSRMGQPKATVPLGGRPLISYPLAAATAAGLDPIVVAKAGTPLPGVDSPVVLEPDEPRHPLRGLMSALEASDGRPVVAVGCDMPFLAAELLSHLAALPAELAVCEVGGRLQPLLGRYEPSLLPHLGPAMEEGWAMTEAVSALMPGIVREDELARFGDPQRLTFNVNDAADLAAAERMLTEPPAPRS